MRTAEQGRRTSPVWKPSTPLKANPEVKIHSSRSSGDTVRLAHIVRVFTSPYSFSLRTVEQGRRSFRTYCGWENYSVGSMLKEYQ